ncbi:MAG TPA: hypothetical protein VK993_12305 [Chthoniobacterales bacterium]|nr:hypothetical protein [Chthoniobacterales bacterium]
MKITRQATADKLSDYLRGNIMLLNLALRDVERVVYRDQRASNLSRPPAADTLNS